MRETIKEEIKDGGKVKRGFKCRKRNEDENKDEEDKWNRDEKDEEIEMWIRRRRLMRMSK